MSDGRGLGPRSVRTALYIFCMCDLAAGHVWSASGRAAAAVTRSHVRCGGRRNPTSQSVICRPRKSLFTLLPRVPGSRHQVVHTLESWQTAATLPPDRMGGCCAALTGMSALHRSYRVEAAPLNTRYCHRLRMLGLLGLAEFHVTWIGADDRGLYVSILGDSALVPWSEISLYCDTTSSS